MSEAEARLHALLLIELLTTLAAEDDALAGNDERPVLIPASATA
jgi:hypothetical protein